MLHRIGHTSHEGPHMLPVPPRASSIPQIAVQIARKGIIPGVITCNGRCDRGIMFLLEGHHLRGTTLPEALR